MFLQTIKKLFGPQNVQKTIVFTHDIPQANDFVRVIDRNSKLYQKTGKIDFLHNGSAYVRIQNFARSFCLFSLHQLEIVPAKNDQKRL